MDEPVRVASPLNDATKALLESVMPLLQVRILEGWRVLALRHLEQGQAAVELALAACSLTPLPNAGSCHGADPWVIWSGPTEYLVLTSRSGAAEDVLQALSPGRETLACAVDQSAGRLIFELHGERVIDVLQGLLDASAIPRHAGQATRARLMDVGACIVRLEPDRVLLVIDRMHGDHVAQWIVHFAQGKTNPA